MRYQEPAQRRCVPRTKPDDTLMDLIGKAMIIAAIVAIADALVVAKMLSMISMVAAHGQTFTFVSCTRRSAGFFPIPQHYPSVRIVG